MRSRRSRNAASGFLLIALLLAMGIGCEDRSPASPTPAQGPSSTWPGPRTVVSLVIAGQTAFTQPGQTSQLTLVQTLSDGTTSNYPTSSWASSDPGIVTITRDGLVTAVGYGQAEVRVGWSGWINNSLPTVAPAQARVMPDGRHLITGRVTEGGFRLEGARVSAASAAGTVRGTSRYDGSYMLAPLVGDVTVRAEGDGFVAQERTLNVQQDAVVDFSLSRGAAPKGIAGVWTLTFSADPSCPLPATVVRRTYVARISEKPDGLVAELDGPGFVFPGFYEYGFTGTIDGTSVHFVVYGDPASDPTYLFNEMLDDGTFLGLTGTAAGVVGDRSIRTVFTGSARWYSGPKALGYCTGEHRLDFTR